MVDPHIDPAQIVGEIVHAVGDHLAEFGDHKVVHPHRFGFAFRTQFSATVLEVAHQFLLLGVHRHDRLPSALEGLHLRVDVLELGVPIRVRRPLPGLAVGLQAVAQLLQQICHQFMADLVTLAVQFVGQLPHALAGPPQRRFGSPRLSGSTNCSRSCNKVASWVTVRLRPPPGRRIRMAVAASGAASSLRPLAMACRETPVARATAEMPP